MKTDRFNKALTHDKIHQLTQTVADAFSEPLLATKDLANADLEKIAEDSFEANTTSILAELIEANKHFPKDEIIFALERMGHQLCLMGLMMRKASELDF